MIKEVLAWILLALAGFFAQMGLYTCLDAWVLGEYNNLTKNTTTAILFTVIGMSIALYLFYRGEEWED